MSVSAYFGFLVFTSDHVVISGACFGFSSESLVIVSDPVGNSNARFGSSGILESDSDLVGFTSKLFGSFCLEFLMSASHLF